MSSVPHTDQPGGGTGRVYRPRSRLPAVRCPVCGERAFVRSSEEVTPIVRLLYYYCSNLPCSMAWKSHLGLVSVISPSGISPDFRDTVLKESKPPGHDFGQMSLLDLCPGDDPPA